MSKDNLTLRTERLFPFQFLVLGGIFVFAGLVTLLIKPFVAPVLLVLGGLILTSFRGVEINPTRHIYREFNSFLLIKSGKWKSYSNVEKIYINASNQSQYVYTKVTTGTTFRNTIFNAYLKFDNGIKIKLLSRKNKDKLVRKLAPFVEQLDVPLQDNTLRH